MSTALSHCNGRLDGKLGWQEMYLTLDPVYYNLQETVRHFVSQTCSGEKSNDCRRPMWQDAWLITLANEMGIVMIDRSRPSLRAEAAERY
jgi:hypothetical protein